MRVRRIRTSQLVRARCRHLCGICSMNSRRLTHADEWRGRCRPRLWATAAIVATSCVERASFRKFCIPAGQPIKCVGVRRVIRMRLSHAIVTSSTNSCATFFNMDESRKWLREFPSYQLRNHFCWGNILRRTTTMFFLFQAIRYKYDPALDSTSTTGKKNEKIILM